MFIRHELYSLIFLILYFIHFNSGQTYTCDPNSSCGCSLSSTSIMAKIVGGEASANSAWGWAAQVLKSGKLTCSAVLISNSYALTAAHCTRNISRPSDLSIIAGTNSLLNSDGAGQQRTIIEYYVHPSYNSRAGTNDIAVLRFSPLSDSSSVKYICLPTANVDPYKINSNVVVAGWGVTSETSRDPSPVLQHVTLQILPSGALPCQRVPIRDASVQVCASVPAGGKDACFGDSGGPMMIFNDGRWVLGGLTSLGIGCARVGYAGIYTRASVFVSFIENVMNSANSGLGSQTSTSSSQNSGSSASTIGSFNNTRHFYFKQILFFLFILFLRINI